MSFVGITFPGQKVTPSADALLMQNILRDGILQGCELTAAGFTLSMAAGSLILCGRSIQHPASENWAVNSTSSVYARLVITIDLSKTAADQITTSVEYASAADGFPALEQSEINVSGVKYQAEICVVSLTAGGISGIVRQMPVASLSESGELLKNLLANNYLQLSNKQIVERVEDIPADAPEGAIFFVPVEE